MEQNEDRAVLSQSAIDALQAELDEFKGSGRQKMSERLLEARELGDLSENAEYDTAKHDQALMEQRISKLERLLRNPMVRESPVQSDIVQAGMAVTIRDIADADCEDTYLLADSEERVTGKRVLSTKSPLGQALMSHKIGDKVTYAAPGGTYTYEIVKLEPA